MFYSKKYDDILYDISQNNESFREMNEKKIVCQWQLTQHK